VVQAHSAGHGRGTEVVVTLPRSRDVPARASTDEHSLEGAPVAARACHVVVVDDSDDVRELLKDALVDGGHDVTTASDGPSGLASILAVVPELAVIDIGLPGLDGYEVARQARAQLGNRVLLVALTGYGQPADRERAKDAGFDVHFTKPVDITALRALFPA
jgi:CheY-like chemotaxis protein